jgi:cellulose synthase/poly-beta-1,6-N-acetylglucosamine synthase-like glycosyltransferase
MEILFWSSIIIVFYAYLGYGILLLIIVKIKMFLTNKSLNTFDDHYFPTVTFIVPCYNEIDMINQKVTNCLSLDYPREKISYIFITDGSNDGTPELVSKYSEITLLHENKREGKSAAENRAMKFVKSEITIFSDANTILPEAAIKKLIRHYLNPKVGAVSGEKK